MHRSQTLVQSYLHSEIRVVKLVTQLIYVFLLEVLGLKMQRSLFTSGLALLNLVVFNEFNHLIMIGLFLVKFESFQRRWQIC